MATDESEAPLGIRDRKRIRTRAQIEEAAISLVLRDGLEATTIDAISERADISSRTFFNYFESKDAALLGVVHPEGTDDELAEVEPSGDVVDDVVRLVLSTMGGPQGPHATLHRDRVEVIRRHPEVIAGQLAALHARADRLHVAIERLLGSSPDFADDTDRSARAQLLLGLAGTAVKASINQWAEAGSRRPVETIHQRAVALVKETARKLS